MYYTYILQLNNKTYYHGYTNDLKQRIEQHENGIVQSTKDLAIKFEKYLKSSSGFAFRNKHLVYMDGNKLLKRHFVL